MNNSNINDNNNQNSDSIDVILPSNIKLLVIKVKVYSLIITSLILRSGIQCFCDNFM